MPPSSPQAQRDPCWSCGYDLSNLDSSTCPECGAHFPSGKDLNTLRARLLGGTSRRCISCGAMRTQPGASRCPTCGMRFSHDAADAVTTNTNEEGKNPYQTDSPEAATHPVKALIRTLLLYLGIAGSVLGLAFVVRGYDGGWFDPWVAMLVRILALVAGVALLVVFVARVRSRGR